MTALSNVRFWAALVGVAGGLSGLGLLVAQWVVPPPPHYYRTAYLEFALPAGWTSDREGAETVCMPPGKAPHKALIIMAVKPRSPRDRRDDYYEHLGKAKTLSLPDGKQVTSEVIHFRKVRIGGYEWVDALHRNSEVPGYSTRYLATVTSHLALAVTFTAAHGSYEAMNREFEKSIRSLRIFQSPSAFN